ncbi:MAG: tetratricopeptide repeat protein [Candidatus Omnitrophica bacterium]|nr:tetratricopeptide repeat protein [Candidatus Omnitrophota bacterium]
MESAEEFYKQAMLLFTDGRYEEAALQLEKALKINDRNADVMEALGVIYERLSRLDEAIILFRNLARIDPGHLMAHSNLSRILAKQGKIAEAEVEQAHARRISWKHQLKERQTSQPAFTIQERVERYKKVIELAPDDVLGYFSLGSAYLESSRWIEAERTFRQALAIDPAHSSSYLGLGQALQEQKKVREAVEVFEKGIPVAEKLGDMIPFKKMSARLREIHEKKEDGINS